VLRLVFLHELPDFHEDFHIGCFFSFFFCFQGKHVCVQSTSSCKVAVNYSMQCRIVIQRNISHHLSKEAMAYMVIFQQVFFSFDSVIFLLCSVNGSLHQIRYANGVFFAMLNTRNRCCILDRCVENVCDDEPTCASTSSN
jgi:hypothetical protein